MKTIRWKFVVVNVLVCAILSIVMFNVIVTGLGLSIWAYWGSSAVVGIILGILSPKIIK